MTDDEMFAAVVRELAALLLQLGPLGAHAVLIGGQVLAIEALSRGGSGVISATTETGVTVDRGFSFEPDLLLDLESDPFMADRLPEILRDNGFVRVRDYRWAKTLDGGLRQIELDLFRAEDSDEEAESTSMTPLPDGALVLRRSVPVKVSVDSSEVRLRVPDPLGFLSMKVRAKLEHRPSATKDCFDIYVYVQMKGTRAISQALETAGAPGEQLLSELKRLYWDVNAVGVRDVLASAVGLGSEEAALLAQAVVDLFADL